MSEVKDFVRQQPNWPQGEDDGEGIYGACGKPEPLPMEYREIICTSKSLMRSESELIDLSLVVGADPMRCLV